MKKKKKKKKRNISFPLKKILMKGAIKMEGLCPPSECLSVGPLLTHLNAALQREGLGGSVTKRLCPLIPPLLCQVLLLPSEQKWWFSP